MQAFYRDGFVGVQSDTKEEKELLIRLYHQAQRGDTWVNISNHPDSNIKIALSLIPTNNPRERVRVPLFMNIRTKDRLLVCLLAIVVGVGSALAVALLALILRVGGWL